MVVLMKKRVLWVEAGATVKWNFRLLHIETDPLFWNEVNFLLIKIFKRMFTIKEVKDQQILWSVMAALSSLLTVMSEQSQKPSPTFLWIMFKLSLSFELAKNGPSDSFCCLYFLKFSLLSWTKRASWTGLVYFSGSMKCSRGLNPILGQKFSDWWSDMKARTRKSFWSLYSSVFLLCQWVCWSDDGTL